MLEELFDEDRVAVMSRGVEALEKQREILWWLGAPGRPDLRMRARHPLLGVREHLLGELLAGPQARIADLDIRQLQLLGIVPDQIHDLHRLAHVEYECLGI